MHLLCVDIGSKRFSNAKILLYGTCVPQEHLRFLQRLSKGKIALDACMQEEHMDRVGFKLATLLRYQPIKEIVVLTNDGSPHCVQLHFLAEQVKTVTGINVPIKHFVIEEGKLLEVTSDTVKKARHLSWIQATKSND